MDQQPPPYEHDWRSVPDTALLPPPPSIGHERSPTSNAPTSAADQGNAWCDAHPLWSPRTVFSAADTLRRREGRIALVRPQQYIGDLADISSSPYASGPPYASAPGVGPGPGHAHAHAPEIIYPSSSSGTSSWRNRLFSRHRRESDSPDQYTPQHDISDHNSQHLQHTQHSIPSGISRGTSHPSCPDATLLSNLPLYAATVDSPLFTEVPKTIYYEVRLLGTGSNEDSALALGFAAQPYPTFRLPGWHRGSLAVHGDDGRRYVNDTWGGKDFVRAFRRGDVLGLGMTFGLLNQDQDLAQNQGQRGKISVSVFFTRNGLIEGSWDLHEEIDAKTDRSGTKGLDGEVDVFAAIGVFGGVEYEVVFDPARWMYKGIGN